MKNIHVDVVVIGGGPAGMNAALVLGRARKEVALIDAERPRNAVTSRMHGFLTRDGVAPSEFRRMAREELGAYPSVSIYGESVTSISGADGAFQLQSSEGTVFKCKKILFAVGMKDSPLHIPGLAEVYGKSAFVCPYCDGWELRDQPLVIIQKGKELLHFAPVIAGWTDVFSVCTNGPDELTDAEREELKRKGVPLFDSPIRRIESRDGLVQEVVLEDGTAVACRGIFFKPQLMTGSDLPQSIGCEMTEAGAVVVNELGKTSLPGVFSAGDAASPFHQTIAAASSGSLAAVILNNELNMEAWRREA
ncbi:pyridine nucleotide-disulfide oxidoreductase, class II [Paenibacillus algicola]|uniref:Pyridine nucleotide-disulfide oxidoreductase, class II n=1 Tax=Paenibacillus algicola TaxID=2565926 RepID=A0A4P8XGN2_9BACL|nr:NAD(P)/FAD-dependent oxidoreductase [Paenibacillus algicola]QCT01283.1 pyridine nucleotide-disulfide oxidoreductase, class II [Paenibacillus algicola]